MYQFTNLPKKDGPEIKGISLNYCYQIRTENGIICEIGKNTDQGTASDIASAIRYARDAGYQQALSDVRRQLGIDK